MKWLPRARDHVEQWGIDPALIEAVARKPTTVIEEAPAGERWWPMQRCRRGDLEVCVSLADPDDPMITWVRVHLPTDQNRGQRVNPGRGRGSRGPTSLQDLHSRIQGRNYRLTPGGKHMRVERPDGTLMMTLPLTPSDWRGLLNAWRNFERFAELDKLARDTETRNT